MLAFPVPTSDKVGIVVRITDEAAAGF
jgi:hypothetical protein